VTGTIGAATAFELIRQKGVDDALRAVDSPVTLAGGRVLFALDHEGHHLLVPVASPDDVAEDRTSAGVQLRARSVGHGGTTDHYIDVVCLRGPLVGVFTTFVDHLLAELSERPEYPERVVSAVLRHWRELLRPDRRATLSEARLVGLIGELQTLRVLAELDPTSALASWQGWRGHHWDFHAGSCAVEVKATTAPEGRVMRMHGLEQLDPSGGIGLVLHFRRYARDHAGSGVADLVADLALAGVDDLEVRRRLAHLGWDPHDIPHARYSLVEECSWQVGDTFPRLVAASLVEGALPSQVTRLEYGLDLSGSDPPVLLPEAYRAHLVRLVTAP